MKRIKMMAATTAMMASLTMFAGVLAAQPAPMTPPSMEKPAPMATMAPAAATMAPTVAVMASAPPVMAVPAVAATKTATAAQPTMEASPPKPKTSGWEKADNIIKLIVIILGGLMTVIGSIVTMVKGAGWRSKLKTARAKKVREYIHMGFPIVESLAKATNWKGDDKLVELGERIDQWLFEEGEPPLGVEETKAVANEVADLSAKEKVERGEPGKVETKDITRANGDSAAVDELSRDLG